MAMNKFILFQEKRKDADQQSQISVVAGNDLATIKAVLATGAVEVGRLQTSLTREQFFEGMNRNAFDAYERSTYTILEIKKCMKKVGLF